MENFYRDNPDIGFHLNHMDLSRVVELKEDGFSEKDDYLEAPNDLPDAIDNYDRVLDIVGEISGAFVAPRAREVDAVGARFSNGEVIYAPGTADALDRLKKADLMGFTLPRRYGGLNMPKTIYSMATEIVSRADASLMNLFGLQEISDTIYKFGSEEQRGRFLPRFSSGEVSGAMALTEPDAGSDLQAVMLKARMDDQGRWRLNGVKRFITNGCADVSLVMARSEEGTTGGRGISLFIYERDERMKIRRIEHKLGINGSPTCELQFNDAPAELLGKRKFGLIKYTMSLMNGARLGVAAQAVGVAEAAWREAAGYARDRIQFNRPIRNFTAITEMLAEMKMEIEAARSLLYETSRIVDIKEGIEEKIEVHPETASDLREAARHYDRLAALFTPMVKAYASEMANSVCYRAIQIHGGVGYTKEFDVERLYRDARITNIYEGTTQLQVVAAIGGVVTGVLFERLNSYENEADFSPVSDLFDATQQFRTHLEKAVSFIKDRRDPQLQEFHAGRLVGMATDTTLAYLLCIDALKSDRKKKVARAFISRAAHRIRGALDYILSGDTSILEFQEDIIDLDDRDQCFIRVQ
ncbi:MAG: acyl-CoA dehydrogenase family protein [Desulfobacterales bacterium]